MHLEDAWCLQFDHQSVVIQGSIRFNGLLAELFAILYT